jgi:hypothetical protein
VRLDSAWYSEGDDRSFAAYLRCYRRLRNLRWALPMGIVSMASLYLRNGPLALLVLAVLPLSFAVGYWVWLRVTARSVGSPSDRVDGS